MALVRCVRATNTIIATKYGIAFGERFMLRSELVQSAHPPLPVQALVQEAKRPARETMVKDPRLLDVFLAASAPVATVKVSNSPSRLVDRERWIEAGQHSRAELSGPQAADIVWACGLLRWLPGSSGSGSGGSGGNDNGDINRADFVGVEKKGPSVSAHLMGRVRLEQLVESVAQSAASHTNDVDGWHVTNVVWAIDRLEAVALQAATERAQTAVTPTMRRPNTTERVGPDTTKFNTFVTVLKENGGLVDMADSNKGETEEGGGLWAGKNLAVRDLRERAERLPFRAVPSLFEGLRVEDFRDEVAFRRDEIHLGGGKVRLRRV